MFLYSYFSGICKTLLMTFFKVYSNFAIDLYNRENFESHRKNSYIFFFLKFFRIKRLHNVINTVLMQTKYVLLALFVKYPLQ